MAILFKEAQIMHKRQHTHEYKHTFCTNTRIPNLSLSFGFFLLSLLFSTLLNCCICICIHTQLFSLIGHFKLYLLVIFYIHDESDDDFDQKNQV